MSVVIVGGNECMVCQYQNICKKHGCKAKVFVKEKGAFKKQLGSPQLMILFTNTVSHKMAKSALDKEQIVYADIDLKQSMLLRNKKPYTQLRINKYYK